MKTKMQVIESMKIMTANDRKLAVQMGYKTHGNMAYKMGEVEKGVMGKIKRMIKKWF